MRDARRLESQVHFLPFFYTIPMFFYYSTNEEPKKGPRDVMNVSWATVRTLPTYYDYKWCPRLVAAPSVSFFFSLSFFYCANKYLLLIRLRHTIIITTISSSRRESGSRHNVSRALSVSFCSIFFFFGIVLMIIYITPATTKALPRTTRGTRDT